MPAKMNFDSKFAERALVAAGRMKRVLLPSVLVILGLSLLTACSAGTSNSTTSSASAVSLPAETVLAAGTLKLEGTAQAIDAQQAADLLPLWQLLKQLKSSSATAQTEVDAVVENIQATMTAEQSSAIDEMGLSQADIVTVESSSGSSSASGTTSARSNSQSAAGGRASVQMGRLRAQRA